MAIGTAIFSILTADSTLNTLLGASTSTAGMKKVYPQIAPQTETPPFITYSVYATVPDHCTDGLAVKRHYVQIDVWSTSPDTSATIAARVLTLLNQYKGTVSGQKIDNILLQDEQDSLEPDLDPPLFGKQIDFSIRETF